MKEVLGCLRRADEDFRMIAPGDHVAVGVSGGKDSLLLLYALALYRRFSKNPYTLTAVTLTMGLQPFDLGGVRALCKTLDVPYIVRETEIGKVIFEERKESELAVELGISQPAVYKRKMKILKKLKIFLEK